MRDVSKSIRSLTRNERMRKLLRSLTKNERQWANRSVCWHKMSKLFAFLANRSFAYYLQILFAKNERFSQKTYERIPNPDQFHANFVFEKRHSTKDRRHVTGDVRQDTWDRRLETGDMKQETWDMIQDTLGRRHDTGDMIQKTSYKRHDTRDRSHSFPINHKTFWHTTL